MTSTSLSQRILNIPGWFACILALIAGACLPLSLAPFHWWPVAIPSLAIFVLLLIQQSPRQLLQRSFFFGLGFYGVGVSWVFVSIHFYGGASTFLAALLTFLFVSFIALVFSLPFYIPGRLFTRTPVALLLAFPPIWMLGEWLRSWLLTGFPWLYLGYGHIDSWLAGWAPVTGIFGVSLIVAFTASVTAHWLWYGRANRTLIAITGLLGSLWIGGGVLGSVNWTDIDDTPVTVAIVQPDIPQDMKWQTNYVQPTLTLLTELSSDLWDNDWIVWPEAAVPLTYHEALPFLNDINQQADASGTGLITGIIYDDQPKRRYYNSVVGFGTALGIYHKRRLVPFGEYVPMEDWLRGIIHFFNLPTSIINLGPWQQSGIRVGDINVAPAICYELAYPDLIAESARSAHVLLNVSNLGWFGASIGPPQFLQMGQMRALETGRYLVYSTNNGHSAVINSRGKITQQTNAFVTETMSGIIYRAEGFTPFMRWGSWPIMIAGVMLLIIIGLSHRQTKS
jgi:apolipoprotein N-acyltransferase